jgi:hypothetical protein
MLVLKGTIKMISEKIPPKMIFIFFVIIGGIINWFFSGNIVVVIGSSICIVAYALFGRLVAKYKSQEFVDTIYYLGFVFTLIALGIALLKYKDNVDIATTTVIITQNGVALFTTIVGLVLRVLFTDIKKEEKPVDDEELKKSMRQLVNELNSLSKGIKENGSKVVEQTEELSSAIKESSTSIEEAGQIVALSVQTIVNDLQKDLADNLKGITGALTKETERHVEEHKELIKQTAGQLKSGIEDLVGRISSLDIPPDIVSSKIEPALSNANAAVQRFADEVDSTVEQSINIQSSWGKLSNIIGELDVQLRDFVGHQSTINEKLTQEQEGLAEQFSKFPKGNIEER